MCLLYSMNTVYTQKGTIILYHELQLHPQDFIQVKYTIKLFETFI